MRDSPSIAAAVAVVGLLVGALAASGQFLPVLLDRPVTGMGSMLFVVSILSFLLNPVGLLVVGYWAGRRVDVANEYEYLLLLLAVVGGGATAVGYLVVSGLALVGVSGSGAGEVVFGVGYNAVVQAVNIAVTCFAGAAFAEFRGT